MTHPIPGADSERALPPLPKPLGIIEYAVKGEQINRVCDGFGSDQMADYVRADRAAAKVGANVAADEIGAFAIDVEKMLCKALGRDWSVCGISIETLCNEVANLRAAGAPAETPKQSHAEWVLRQISQLAPHQGATAIFMATEGLAAQPATAATYCDSINNFLSETLEIPEKQTAFRDRFSKWLNLGCPLPDATPIAGDVEKYALDWTEDFPHENGNYMNICSTCKNTFFGHKRRITCKQCAAMLANSSSGEAG